MSDYLLLKKSKSFKSFYTFFNKKWYFDKFYNQFISQNLLYSSYHFSYKDIDRGILEGGFGPYGLVLFLEKIAKFLRFYQSGNIFHYLFLFFISSLILIFFVLFF